LRTAENEKADYVLAQDPDSDRFMAAEKGPTGNWIIFTGDQLGNLFADRIFESYKLSGHPMENLAMVASTVSSKMLGAMAKAEGFRFVECLTGFKFIGNTALDLVKEGFEVPFGYEEAIGFMFGHDIRDKDGIAAMVSFAELAVTLHANGKTVNERLQELYSKYGHFELLHLQ
jgi:phosphoglucomutase